MIRRAPWVGLAFAAILALFLFLGHPSLATAIREKAKCWAGLTQSCKQVILVPVPVNTCERTEMDVRWTAQNSSKI